MPITLQVPTSRNGNVLYFPGLDDTATAYLRFRQELARQGYEPTPPPPTGGQWTVDPPLVPGQRLHIACKVDGYLPGIFGPSPNLVMTGVYDNADTRDRGFDQFYQPVFEAVYGDQLPDSVQSVIYRGRYVSPEYAQLLSGAPRTGPDAPLVVIRYTSDGPAMPDDYHAGFNAAIPDDHPSGLAVRLDWSIPHADGYNHAILSFEVWRHRSDTRKVGRMLARHLPRHTSFNCELHGLAIRPRVPRGSHPRPSQEGQ